MYLSWQADRSLLEVAYSDRDIGCECDFVDVMSCCAWALVSMAATVWLMVEEKCEVRVNRSIIAVIPLSDNLEKNCTVGYVIRLPYTVREELISFASTIIRKVVS